MKLDYLYGFFLMFCWVNFYAQGIGVASVSSPTVVEGGVLVHTITLTGETTSEVVLPYAVNNFQVDFFGEFNSDIAQVLLPDGQFFDNNFLFIIVPPGHSSFTLEITSNDDNIEEEDESYGLRIGTIDATGTILDNDSDTTTVITISTESETEGADIVHTVELSNPTSVSKTFPFSFIDITTVASMDYNDVLFSDGIVYNTGTGMLTIPDTVAGISSFTITISTLDDTIIESNEFYNITIGTIVAMGTVIDNDMLTISVDNVNAVEGEDLIHSVVLGATVNEEVMFEFLIVDITTGSDDYNFPEFDNGVLYDPNSGFITIPVGVDDFNIIIATVDDTLIENDESYELTIGDEMVTGEVLDNDALNIPRFFTPNNDEVNDTWPIDLIENNDQYRNASIHIFNRYGKLLKEINPDVMGWDGTFNGQKMPPDDYWYRIVFEDNNVVKGHFTLKR